MGPASQRGHDGSNRTPFSLVGGFIIGYGLIYGRMQITPEEKKIINTLVD